MTNYLSRLPILVLALGSPLAGAESQEERLKSLEARIAELEEGGKAQVIAQRSAADRVKLNGFLSAGAGTADTDEGFIYDNGLYRRAGFRADAIFGLQLDARVNDETNAVVQMVSRGPDDFASGAEWAYVGYRPNSQDQWRAGRQRTSFYMLSEYLEVGYAYPWARPPAEVYRASMPSSYDGISWQHAFEPGAWQHDIKVNLGVTHSPPAASSQFDAEDSWGLRWTSGYGSWQFNADLAGGKLTVDNPLVNAFVDAGLIQPTVRAPARYSALGVNFDNGHVVAMAEATRVEARGVLPDSDAGYVTLGFRAGPWMPHITYAGVQVTDSDEPQRQPFAALSTQDDLFGGAATPDLCPRKDPDPATSLCLAVVPAPAALPAPLTGATTLGIPFPADSLSRLLDAEQESVTLGLRYDFLPNAAFKIDWTRVLDMHNTFGLINARDGNLFYDASGALLTRPDRGMDVFRAVVDVTF